MRLGFRHFQIIAPAALSLGLFWMAIFFFLLPAFESSIVERRREMLREIVHITWSLLSEHAQRVTDGELSLPDAQTRAVACLRNLRYGPENKDYVWINDMHPRMIMHPYRSDLEGQDITNFADPNGKHLFVEFVNMVETHGSGYVDYMWQWKDDSTRIVPKVSYVKAFEPWGWIIGTGMYTEDVRAEVSRLTRTIARVGLVILVLVTGLSLYTAAHGTRIESRRRQAALALRESEERLSQAISISRAAVWEVDLTSGTISVGEETRRMLGYDADEMPTNWEQWRELHHPDEHEELVRVVQAHLRGETPACTLESRWRARDGCWKWIYSQARVVDRDEQGRPTRMIGTSLDITQRRHAEDETRRLRNLLSSIVNSMPSVLVGVDPEGRVTQWNREAEKTTGVTPNEAHGQPLEAVFPQLAPQMDEVRRAIHDRQTRRSEKVSCEIDGQTRLWDITVYPLATNIVEGAVIRVDDVTQRVKIEEMMVQAEKMMSVGGLAAGMAHEINNPLGGILQGAQNIERRLSPELDKNRQIAAECNTSLDSVRDYLEKRQVFAFLRGIRESGSRAARIVANMLQFSRRGEAQPVPTSLAELLDRAVDLAANDYDLKKKYDFRHIDITREYDADLPLVPVMPMEIEQVFLNLLKNGAQAMRDAPEGRRPRFVLRLKHLGDMVQIEIEDNGVGMPENVRKRVFEPFFTTKTVGVGTGLGLSVSYMLITQNHKGTIEVDSTLGKGTRFTIRLPISAV